MTLRDRLIPPLIAYYTMNADTPRADGIISSGLVAEYKFDEGSGTTVVDHIGNYDMTLGATTATPTWGSGYLEFDGTNDKVTSSIPDSYFTNADGFTAILVMKQDSYYNATLFLGKGTGTTNQPCMLRVAETAYPAEMYLVRGNATVIRAHRRGFVEYGSWCTYGVVSTSNLLESEPELYINAKRYKGNRADNSGTGAVTGNDTIMTMGYLAATIKTDGPVAYALIYNRALSQTEMETNYNALITIMAARSITLPAIGTAIVLHGDSLTRGNGVSAINEDYPSQLRTALGAGYDIWNFGIAAIQMAALITDGTGAVDYAISSARSRHICVIWGGANDIDDNRSAVATYASLETYIAARKAAGFDNVIVLTALDRAQYDEAQRIQYAAYNTLIKDGAATGGYTVADVDGNANLQDFTDTTYFNADQVHLVAAGYAVVAGIVKTAIEAVMAA